MEKTSHFKIFCQKTIKAIGNFLFPPQCPYCDKQINSAQIMCDACFKRISFIKEPKCYRCSRPLGISYKTNEKLLCPNCLKKRPAYDLARSCFIYDSFSRQSILRFKYMDRTDLRHFFVHYLLKAGADVIEKSDVIIPVPMYWTRRVKRTYNQAAVIAELLAQKANKPYHAGILIRTRATETQTHKTAAERQQNIKNAFEVALPNEIYQKSVLIIDDVLTTGATAQACAKALKEKGAKAVYLLTIAQAITE